MIRLEEEDDRLSRWSNLSLKASFVIKMGNEVIDHLNSGVEERWGVGKEEGMQIKVEGEF